MPLTRRQKQIAKIVEANGPITGDKIAGTLNVTRAALRSDLAILIMSGILEARTKVGYFYTGKKTVEVFSQELENILVKDIKSLPVVVDEAANAYDTLVAMFTEDVGSIYVVEKKDILTGVVSRKDLLKTSLNSGSDLTKIPIKLIMTSLAKLITIQDSEPVVVAAKKLIDNEIDSLPVVQEIDAGKKKYKIIGRLTKTNITRLLVELVDR